VAFESDSCLSGFGERCFSGCSSLSAISNPSSVEAISDGCFECCELLSNLIPNSHLLGKVYSSTVRDCHRFAFRPGSRLPGVCPGWPGF
jgi:hypothetical protein